ncbi:MULTISPECIES: hypothetical protein [Enterobacteriaceae]|uniref:hypothetical protein n=1 Tax=Enterobacteriaceae TaxID=543 RepID=UPI0024DDFA2B|nr:MULTISPECIES: hypothetical protein [Enterobacteriaceae]MDK2579365.1 hypothetical protein [Citrobacter portucalensis]
MQIKGASLDSALVNGAGSAPKKCECQDGFGYPHPGKIYIVPQVEMIKNWS